jgi:hypothetical protein
LNDWTWIALRLIHIVGGTLWVGAALFIALFLEPAISDAGPAGGKVMHGIVEKRKLPIYMTLASWLSILAGIWLYWRDSGHLEWEWVKTGPGISYTAGGLVAIAVAFMGQFVNATTAGKMSALGQKMQTAGGPPADTDLAEMSRLQRRMRTAARVEAVLLIFVVVTMAVGRNLVV